MSCNLESEFDKFDSQKQKSFVSPPTAVSFAIAVTIFLQHDLLSDKAISLGPGNNLLLINVQMLS